MIPPKSVCWWLIINSQTDWQYCSGCHVLPDSKNLQQLAPRSLPALRCGLSSVQVRCEPHTGLYECHLPHPEVLPILTNTCLQQNSTTDHRCYYKLQDCADYAVICFHLQSGFLVSAKFDLLLRLCSYFPCGEQESLPLAQSVSIQLGLRLYDSFPAEFLALQLFRRELNTVPKCK